MSFTQMLVGKLGEIGVFIVSMLPLVELRGGIIVGAAADINPILCYIIAVVANMLPIPFILLLLKKVLAWLKKTKLFSKPAMWIENKILSKRDRLEKFEIIGLILFVAIPLPGTGAWTGAGLAALLDMPIKKSFPAIFAGVLIAGVIMTLGAYGIFGAFKFLAS